MGILNRLFGGKMNEPGEERTEKQPAEPQIRPVPEEETVTEKEPQEIIRVYEGYYFNYDFVSNGWGGYHPVNLTFNHDVKRSAQTNHGRDWLVPRFSRRSGRPLASGSGASFPGEDRIRVQYRKALG